MIRIVTYQTQEEAPTNRDTVLMADLNQCRNLLSGSGVYYGYGSSCRVRCGPVGETVSLDGVLVIADGIFSQNAGDLFGRLLGSPRISLGPLMVKLKFRKENALRKASWPCLQIVRDEATV